MAKVKLSTPKKFGQFVKWRRLQMGWTQEELAVRSFGEGAKHTMISNIESGNSITLLTMDKVLSAIGSDVDFHN